VCAWVLARGFSHVSDDDYSRVTIAQAFAHAPRLDPSGTSWLPFPFWLNGVAMQLAGRSLAVARGVAILSGIAGAVLVYRMLLRAGVAWIAALVGVGLATCDPLSSWLGAATVPEALTASLVVVASVGLARADTRLPAAFAILVASLSRYEAWPVAFVVGVACAVAVALPRPVSPRSRRTDALACAVALAGPVAWVAWNAHAHGDPLHFLARVAAFRARVTAGAAPLWTLYPAALWRLGSLALLVAAAGASGLWVDRGLWRRWAGPLAAAVAMAAFLVVGDLRNGAPTHHPERALVAIFWMATLAGVDGLYQLAAWITDKVPSRRPWVIAAAVVAGLAWAVTWPSRVADFPGRGPGEDRAAQVARGQALRDQQAAHLTVTPCAYEHFAVIAAFGAPERVSVLPATSAPVTDACPRIDVP
jgi:hypothetical protein